MYTILVYFAKHNKNVLPHWDPLLSKQLNNKMSHHIAYG